MSTLQIQFAFAGLCFGAWPLFMNKSGLSGIIASFTITSLIMILTLPFIFGEVKNIVNANWAMVLCAGISSALGMIALNKGLFRASPQEVSTLFLILIVVQIIIPGIYKFYLSGALTIKQAISFILAGVIAVLLN